MLVYNWISESWQLNSCHLSKQLQNSTGLHSCEVSVFKTLIILVMETYNFISNGYTIISQKIRWAFHSGKKSVKIHHECPWNDQTDHRNINILTIFFSKISSIVNQITFNVKAYSLVQLKQSPNILSPSTFIKSTNSLASEPNTYFR